MTRLLSATALIIPSLLFSLAQPLVADHAEEFWAVWALTPEADRPHPNNVVLSIPVSSDTTVTNCLVDASHIRLRWDLETWATEYFALPKGGKMKVDLDVATAEGVTTVARNTVKVRRDEEQAFRMATLRWVDPSGATDDPDAVRIDSFPLDLSAGDMLLFSVRFTKKLKVLGVERAENSLRKDRLFFLVICSTCGSNDAPCP